MANIRKVAGANGVAYKITVSYGRDHTGKQKRHYTTYTPPKGISEAKAQKKAERLAMEFEEQIKQGYRIDERKTFSEYSEEFLQNKLRGGLKKSTYERYVRLLGRIKPAIGHLKLQEIRPNHLNAFYDNLSEKGLRLTAHRALPIQDIGALMAERGITQEEMARRSKLAPSTIRQVREKKLVQWKRAEAIATVLNLPVDMLFRKITDDRRLSPKSISEHHRLIHSILRQAERELLVTYNAADKVIPPKARRKEIVSLEPEDIVNILQALETEPIKWRTIIHLMIITGCRRGEIMGLRWEQVDMEKGVISICETLLALDSGVESGTPKTPESRRYINLPAESIALLTEYKTYQDKLKADLLDYWQDSGYVFTRDNGQPMHPDSVNRWLCEFSKRHGLPHLNPHLFRHTHASVLINCGTDISSVSRRLGHTTPTTTLNFYCHSLKKADAVAAECIADALLRGNEAEVDALPEDNT